MNSRPLSGTREEPELASQAISDSPALLHSLAHFGDLPMAAIDLVAPRKLVEVGGEGGDFTRSITAWAEENDAEVICVDPAPSADLRELATRSRLELIEVHSPAALEDVGPCDVYILDGDHNYHVVRGELDAIARDTLGDRARDPLVIMHDVNWPFARRDLYYGPEQLSPDAVWPHSFTKGVSPHSSALVDVGGFSGAGAFAIADKAGGERNGVLTAAEDFCADRDELEFVVVPAIYGLGFLFPAGAGWAASLRGLLEPHAGSELLANLEANRLALFTRVLELQAELERQRVAFERALGDYEDRVGGLTAENLRLRAGEANGH